MKSKVGFSWVTLRVCGVGGMKLELGRGIHTGRRLQNPEPGAGGDVLQFRRLKSSVERIWRGEKKEWGCDDAAINANKNGKCWLLEKLTLMALWSSGSQTGPSL